MAFTGWKLSGLATDELIPLVSPTGGTPTSVTQYINDVACTTQSATQVGLNGGLTKTGTPIAGGSSYVVVSTDLVLLCSTSSAIGITLPTAASSQYRTLQVVDVTGGATSSNVTVTVSGGGTINGASSYVINSAYGTATFFSTGSAWIVVNKIVPAGGGGGGGYATGVRQIVSSTTTSVSSTTTLMPQTSSIPSSSQGAQFATASITPQSSTSSILVFGSLQASTGNINTVTAAIFRDSATSAITAASMACLQSNTSLGIFFFGLIASSSTSASTFKLRAGPSGAGTLTVNGYGGSNQLLGAASNTGLVLVEFGA
jgi:hypothetical protein